MWSIIVETGAQAEFNCITSVFGRYHCVHKTTSGRIFCVEVSLVGFAHTIHLLFKFDAGLFALCSQLFKLAAKNSLHRRVAFHNTHTAGGPTENEVRIES